MSPHISIVIPAYQEEGRVGRTVRTLRRALAERPDLSWELTVVDDGSVDKTAFEAGREGARVLRLPRNAGKGAALLAGFQEATGSVLVMVDADVVETADQALLLLEPILGGRADMAVGAFQRPPGLTRKERGGGFGLVLALARWGLRRLGGPELQSPLSGQRALTRGAWERIGRLDTGFAGLEMGLNLDAARAGLRIVEVPVTMHHRITGRNWAGFRHRGRQFLALLRAILLRWR